MRVVVAGFPTLFRQALAALLAGEPGCKVVGLAADVDEARQLCAREHPDAVVLDAAVTAEAPGGHPDAEASIHAVCPSAGLLWIGRENTHTGAASAVCAHRSPACVGASYLPDCVDRVQLLHTLRSLVAGREGDTDRHPPGVPALITPREREIMALVAEGLSNKEIAHRLDIHLPTVKYHVSHLLEKLGLVDRTQLAVYWLEHEGVAGF